jgi:seryl-tRNA(Sec) selenium transferase
MRAPPPPGADPANRAEQAIAARLGAEDAVIVATAGLALVAALACLAQRGTAVMQRGHVVDLGPSPLELARMAGTSVHEVGVVDACDPDELAQALEHSDAGLFVADPEASAPGLIELPSFVWACHAALRPVLIHHRGRLPWDWLWDSGADLVSLDLRLTLGGPGGLIAGTRPCVERARRQVLRSSALFAPPAAMSDALLACLGA